MNIALVGVDNRIKEILELTKLMTLPFSITAYPYSHYTELPEIIKTIRKSDGILFAGTFPYSLALDKIDRATPVAHLDFDETCIMKFIAASPLEQAPDAISIDSVQSSVVKQIYRELNLPLSEVSSILRSKSQTVEDIANFHIENYKKNQQTHIISGLFSVHKYLRQRDYPCTLINHSYFSVLKGMNKIIDTINFKNSSSNHPAVVIIQIDKNDKHNRFVQNEYKYQHFLYKYLDYLIDFQERLQSFVFNKGSENYYLISTRNLIEEYTNNYRDFPLLYDVFVKFGFTISVGIGYGLNPTSAMSNAAEALDISTRSGNSVKILTESGQVISPTAAHEKAYSIRNYSEDILAIAKKSEITPENINKIIISLDQQGSNHLTAYDLSKALGITTRSGSRLIAKLHSAGYAKESGLEKPSKGRPRRVYELLLEEKERSGS